MNLDCREVEFHGRPLVKVGGFAHQGVQTGDGGALADEGVADRRAAIDEVGACLVDHEEPVIPGDLLRLLELLLRCVSACHGGLRVVSTGDKLAGLNDEVNSRAKDFVR